MVCCLGLLTSAQQPRDRSRRAIGEEHHDGMNRQEGLTSDGQSSEFVGAKKIANDGGVGEDVHRFGDECAQCGYGQFRDLPIEGGDPQAHSTKATSPQLRVTWPDWSRARITWSLDTWVATKGRFMLDLDGASALVTGGASGLGLGCAKRLAASGAKVLIADMNEEMGNAAATEVGGMFVHADVADAEQMQAAVDAAGEMGPLRAAVNAAGVGHAMRTVNRNGDPFDLEAFETVVRINLIGTFNSTRLAAAAMSKTEPLADNERGSIVNFASVAAFDGQIGQAAYSATKAGIAGMTLPIARDLSAIGVRVNTVAPGLFDTPIYDKMVAEGRDPQELKDALGANALFPKRLGFADELATLVQELITNSYMNGETIRIDAGIRLPPK